MQCASEFALHVSADASESRVAALTRELRNDLLRAADVSEVENLEPTEPGKRGDALTLGQLILTFMTSGVATAVVHCVAAYIKREPSLKVVVKGPDGRVFELSMQNIDDPSILGSVNDLLDRK